MKSILILSAFPEEQTYYFNTLCIKEKKKISFVNITVCEHGNTHIYLATTGMGTINASLVLSTLASQLSFDAVFFSGTAGGIDAQLKTGDVVVATQTFDADIFKIHDVVIGTPFEGALINPNQGKATPRFFDGHPQLLNHVKVHNWAFNVFHGRIATSNHFPSPAVLFEEIKVKNALAIDMESTAVYQFAWVCSMPCLVVRGISNILDDKGADDHVAMSEISCSDHAAMLVMDCIDQVVHGEKLCFL